MKIFKLLNNNIVANQVKAFPKISQFGGKGTSFKFTKHQSRMDFSLVGTSIIWRKPDSLL